ncbi:hemolysin III family protein [Klugiella xanthotipulae]
MGNSQRPENTGNSDRPASVADDTARDTGPGLAEDGAVELPNIPLLEASDTAPVEVKPTWRGWIHAGTFPVTIIAGVVLIVLAEGTVATWAATVFTLSSMLLFGNSALYHRVNWRPAVKKVFKRIDHANIFVLIAGTYTPLALLALPPEKGILLLVLVWAGAVLGIGFRVFWLAAPRWLYVAIYILLGWAAVMYMGDLFRVSPTMMVLVIVGGLCYTAGAVIYGLKKPNPVPGVFGFHEIFHTLTVIAFLCHWVATLIISLHPAYHAG